MCCPLVFEFSVGIGGFVIGLGQISFFFSLQLLKIGALKQTNSIEDGTYPHTPGALDGKHVACRSPPKSGSHTEIM